MDTPPRTAAHVFGQHFVSCPAVSPKTTRNICITLQSMWATAKAWHYVAHDIMEGVVLPDSKRRQRYFASQQQIQLIIAAAKEPYRTFFGLAAETGLRPGELCELTVDDLDLERGLLQVQRSAWRGKLGDPKTDDSIRVVELSPNACEHLKTFLTSWRPNAGCSLPRAMELCGTRIYFSNVSSSRY